MSKPTAFDPAWLVLLSAAPASDADLAAQLRALDAVKTWAQSFPEGEEAGAEKDAA